MVKNVTIDRDVSVKTYFNPSHELDKNYKHVFVLNKHPQKDEYELPSPIKIKFYPPNNASQMILSISDYGQGGTNRNLRSRYMTGDITMTLPDVGSIQIISAPVGLNNPYIYKLNNNKTFDIIVSRIVFTTPYTDTPTSDFELYYRFE